MNENCELAHIFTKRFLIKNVAKHETQQQAIEPKVACKKTKNAVWPKIKNTMKK